eukprot:3387973-Amphidinium_carterae.1
MTFDLLSSEAKINKLPEHYRHEVTDVCNHDVANQPILFGQCVRPTVVGVESGGVSTGAGDSFGMIGLLNEGQTVAECVGCTAAAITCSRSASEGCWADV